MEEPALPTPPKSRKVLNVILFILLYPLSLPALWRSPNWNIWVKVLLTLPVILIAVAMFALFYFAPAINEDLLPTQEIIGQCISECNIDVTANPFAINNACFADCYDKAKQSVQ